MSKTTAIMIFWIWAILEILSLFLVAHFLGWRITGLLWLVFAILGVILLTGEEAKQLKTHRAGKKELSAETLLYSAITVLSGALLVFPGFLGDFLVLLLLIPGFKKQLVIQIMRPKPTPKK